MADSKSKIENRKSDIPSPGFQPLAGLTDARLLSLLAESRFAFSMHGWEGDVADFFAPTSEKREILAQRALSLREHPGRYCRALEEAAGPLGELAQLASTWAGRHPFEPCRDALACCRNLALALEPDFLLLVDDGTGVYRGVAGAVCFPSSWDIRIAIGRGMHRIHSRVPGLNEQLGGRIDEHLARLPPGRSWTRLNWGVSLSATRNQHPLERTPRLADAGEVAGAWLRVELQLLHKLPGNSAILFGIRIRNIPFDCFRAHPAIATILRERLAAMSPDLLDYKGIGKNAPLLDPWLKK